jgi:hypothetical protein
MTTKTEIRRSPHVIVDRVDGVTMFCDTSSIAFYKTNELGAFIWDNCEEQTSEEMESILHQVYPSEDRGRISNEVRRVLAMFRDAELIIASAPEY